MENSQKYVQKSLNKFRYIQKTLIWKIASNIVQKV